MKKRKNLKPDIAIGEPQLVLKASPFSPCTGRVCWVAETFFPPSPFLFCLTFLSSCLLFFFDPGEVNVGYSMNAKE